MKYAQIKSPSQVTGALRSINEVPKSALLTKIQETAVKYCPVLANKLQAMLEGTQLPELKTPEAKRKEEAVPIPKPEEIVALWNQICTYLPATLTPGRRQKIKTRCKDATGRDLDWWRKYFEAINSSPFLRGERSSNNWKASLDWVIHDEERVTKILEGTYAENKKPIQMTTKQVEVVENQVEQILGGLVDGKELKRSRV